jgi:hypothetical protein
MPGAQKIFAVARPTPEVTWEDMVTVMQTEAAHVWALYERNILRDAWIRTDALGAVYVLETAPDAAAGLLSEQPMVRYGLVDFEVVPVGPYTPLSLLFGTQQRPIAPATRPQLRPRSSNRVLALDRPRREVGPDDLAPHLSEDIAEAWALWKAGIIRERYLRTDRPGGALMLEVAGVEGAHAVLRRLPLARAGLIEFECLSLATFVGFDAIFDGSLDDPLAALADATTNEFALLTFPIPRRETE